MSVSRDFEFNNVLTNQMNEGSCKLSKKIIHGCSADIRFGFFFHFSVDLYSKKKEEWRDESYRNEHQFTFANGYHHEITAE